MIRCWPVPFWRPSRAAAAVHHVRRVGRLKRRVGAVAAAWTKGTLIVCAGTGVAAAPWWVPPAAGAVAGWWGPPGIASGGGGGIGGAAFVERGGETAAVVAVPEPASIALLTVGALAVVLVRRR